jgi:hypothetical protein
LTSASRRGRGGGGLRRRRHHRFRRRSIAARGAAASSHAGSAEKCRWVTEDLGYDACVDYKHENVAARLAELCPRGIDVYFDNVGGDILNAVLAQINLKARIVLCGAISMYNAVEPPPGPSNYINLVIKRGRMEGFIVSDFLPRFPRGAMQLMQGSARARSHAEDIVDGLGRRRSIASSPVRTAAGSCICRALKGRRRTRYAVAERIVAVDGRC